MKKCPYCAEEIQDEAIVCRYCGRPLVTQGEEMPPPVKPVRQSKPKKLIAFALIVLILLAAILLAIAGMQSGYITELIPALASPTPACGIQAAAYLDEMDSILSDWDDTASVANSTARIALSGPVSNLQTIRKRVQDLEPPECARYTKVYLIGYMDQIIEGFISFMADESETEINSHFNGAETIFDQFMNEVRKIQGGQ